MYKRITKFLLIFVLTLVLVACVDNTTSNDTTQLTTDSTETTSGIVTETTDETTTEVTTTDVITTEELFVLLDRAAAQMNVGDEITLVAEMTDASLPTFVWTSENPEIATVENGVITALSAGQTTIRVTVDNIFAECVVTVSNVVDLIFPELDSIAFVGDEIQLGAFAKVNGIDVFDNITITGEGFTIDGDKITFTDSGIIDVTVSYPEVADITRTITVYHEVSTIADFNEINNDLDGYYMLTANLDFNGEALNTIAHYAAGYSSSDNGFSGVFDGNGYSISNFYANYANDLAVLANSSPFGTIANDGVVRNTNFINVLIKTRISGGIATINYGLIENCFAQVYVVYDTSSDVNNPIGGLVSKNYGDIANSIAVVDVLDGISTINIGGVVGRTLNGSTITNSYSISTVGKFESAVPTNGDMAGLFTNFEGYSDIASFYENAVVEDYSDLWVFDSTNYPHLGEIQETIEITNTHNELYAGKTLQIEVNHNYPVAFSLATEITGVSIDSRGLLTVDDTVAGATEITVLVKSLLNPTCIDEYTITILENAYSITSNSTEVNFNWILGVSEIQDHEALHGIQVLYNGEPYTGEFTIVSSNENIAIIENGKIVAVGDGTVQIDVIINSQVLHSITVNSVMYHPIYTTEEFLAIGTDLTTMSAKYILMNDLDFEGAAIHAFSSYKTKNGTSGLFFSGVFDGNNHTIANFEPHHNTEYSNDRDRAIFGYMSSTAVVKNVNFIGVIGKDRVAVVSNWNEGTIENIYVEMVYVSTATADNRTDANPAGVIVAKNRTTGVVKDVIVVLNFNDGATTQYIGGIIGVNNGTITNVHTITNNPTTVSIYKDYEEASDAYDYYSLEAFYTESKYTNFNVDWTFQNGCYPFLGDLIDNVDITLTADGIYLGKSIQIEVTNRFGVWYEISEPITGVTLSTEGLLTVAEDCVPGTIITINVISKYGLSQDSISLTIKENNFTVSATQDVFNFDWIDGYSTEDLYKASLGITVYNNGEVYDQPFDLVIANPNIVTVENDMIIAIGDGSTTIDVVINSVTLYTLTVNSVKWNPITTTEEFLAIGTDLTTMSAKYILMNDLDFEGAAIHAFSSYKTKNGTSGLFFSGIFDGNNHTIANFEPHHNLEYSNDRDRAIFGYMSSSAVVKNVNFIGVIGKDRVAVVSNWNEGTIENIYVEMVYVSTATADNRTSSNPAGVIVAKNRTTGNVSDVIVVLNFANGATTQYLGGIIGVNSGIITNVHTITNNLTTVSIYNDYEEETSETYSYYTLEEFYTANNYADFNADWTFQNGYYPFLGTLSETVDVTLVAEKIYLGTSLQIEVSSKYGIVYQLAEPVTGVTLSADGLLTVANEAVAGTLVTVNVYSVYGVSQDSITLTISENNFSVTSVQDEYNFDWIDGYSTEDKYQADLDITVYNDGVAYTGTYELVVANPAIVTIENGKIIAIGDGTTTIDVVINSVALYTLTVNSIKWNPITTTQEFLAIGTSLDTMSAKYILMNDLDFEGAAIEAFSSYKTKNGASGLYFSGIFDGNNHTIANFEPYYNTDDSTDRDRSLFGYLSSTAVVKNVNFIGVIGKDRVSVVSNWNEGTVENIYVEMVYVSTATLDNRNNSNPAGVVVAKNRSTGVVQDIITVLTFADGATTQYVGGVIGANSGLAVNIHTITNNPTTNAIFNDYQTETSVAYQYADLDAFYTANNYASFNTDWSFVQGTYPHLGTITDSITITNTETEITVGTNLQITATSYYGFEYALSTPIEGVTITETGLLEVGLEVSTFTAITVVLTSIYDSTIQAEITLTVV